jgi:predicted transposase/invertase (TIGR01784 family)
MNIFALTSIACLLFDTTPSNSLKWTYAHDGDELRRRSIIAFPSHRTLPNSCTHSTFALKDAAHSDPLAKYGTQVYGVATYDALFKWILDDPEVRPSFFHALVPGINVTYSERLDENMNPLQEFQLLRKFVNNNDTQKTVANLKNSSGFEVRIKKNNQTKYTQFNKGTDLLTELLAYFGDIIKGFPSENYDGRMDFVCRLDTGEYALVETQIVRQDFWDMRALAYIAAFYGKQIRKGGEWKDIKKVIGINILGGGIDTQNPWKDAPNEYLRHYRVQEQVNKGRRFIEGLELYQYSLANIRQTTLTDEQRDWLIFLRDGYKKTEADVEQIKTPSVRRAFERAKLNRLTQAQLEAYESEDVQFRRIAGLIKEEREEACRQIAVRLLKENLPLDLIARTTGLSTEEIQSLKK